MANETLASVNRRFWSLTWRIAGLILGGLALYLAVRDVELAEIGRALQQANPAWLVVALGSVAANTLGKAVRWKTLVGQPGRGISFWEYLVALLVGQMLNTVLPARLGELSRAYAIGGRGPGRTYVLGTVMVEKVLDMLAYAVLFLVLLILLPLPAWIQDSGYTFASIAVAAGGLVILVTYQEKRIERVVRWGVRHLPDRLETWLLPRLEAAFRSLVILQNRAGLGRLATWTVVIWITALLNNYLVLLAFDLQLPLTASLLVLIGLQAGISLPSVPGRLGIFEYICVLALSSFDIPQALAFGYGIVLHGIVLLPTTLLGTIFFMRLGPQRRQIFTPEASHESK